MCENISQSVVSKYYPDICLIYLK